MAAIPTVSTYKSIYNGRLRVVHPVTRERLLTPAEAYVACCVAKARVLEEAAQRQAAEACTAHTEVELAWLRAEMARTREEK